MCGTLAEFSLRRGLAKPKASILLLCQVRDNKRERLIDLLEQCSCCCSLACSTFEASSQGALSRSQSRSVLIKAVNICTLRRIHTESHPINTTSAATAVCVCGHSKVVAVCGDWPLLLLLLTVCCLRPCHSLEKIA